jgi:hypothetical protein
MRIIKNIRKLFFGETYQEVLDRKYGGSIPSNILVNGRELDNTGKKKVYKIEVTDSVTSSGSSFYNFFYPHHLNKHHFRKKKITKIFSL